MTRYIVANDAEKASILVVEYGPDVWFDDLDYAKDIAATLNRKVFRVVLTVEPIA